MKSSIPKVNASKPVGNTKLQAKLDNVLTSNLQSLHHQELQRAVNMQKEEKIAEEVVRKLRDHPNEHLAEMQTEVAMLQRKMEPLL